MLIVPTRDVQFWGLVGYIAQRVGDLFGGGGSGRWGSGTDLVDLIRKEKVHTDTTTKSSGYRSWKEEEEKRQKQKNNPQNKPKTTKTTTTSGRPR